MNEDVSLSRAARRFWESVIVAAIVLIVIASVAIALFTDVGEKRVAAFSVPEGALVAHLTGLLAWLKYMGHKENLVTMAKS